MYAQSSKLVCSYSILKNFIGGREREVGCRVRKYLREESQTNPISCECNGGGLLQVQCVVGQTQKLVVPEAILGGQRVIGWECRTAKAGNFSWILHEDENRVLSSRGDVRGIASPLHSQNTSYIIYNKGMRLGYYLKSSPS